MSCTDGSGDCTDVMRDVWLFLDNELDPDRRATVQHHLDECSPCLEEAGIDQKLKELLARKCREDHAPARLRDRIVTQLVAWRTETAEGIRTETVTRSTTTFGRIAD